MIFIEYLNRWLARAAVKSHLEQLAKAEDNIDASAATRPEEKELSVPEFRMDDSPPGYHVRWWF